MAKPQLRKLKKGVSLVKAIRVSTVNYKGTATLRRFIPGHGKIRARRITGVSVQEQRKITKAVKNARKMALLPYSSSVR